MRAEGWKNKKIGRGRKMSETESVSVCVCGRVLKHRKGKEKKRRGEKARGKNTDRKR